MDDEIATRSRERDRGLLAGGLRPRRRAINKRAWDAAQAGWVRAPLTGDRGAALRADLDRLVVSAIVPDRASVRATARRIALRSQWEQFKDRWK